MRSGLVPLTLLPLTLLTPAASTGIDQAIDPSTPGVYLLVKVNGESLPSVSGTKTAEGRHCKDEALGGAMLLDSAGRWAALVTERETCTNRDDSQTVSGERSELFIGSYETSGDRIVLHDETLGLGDDEGSLAGGVLVVKDVGKFDYEGQTTEWIFQKPK